MTKERFAELSRKRDVAVGITDVPFSEYLQEASFYLALPPAEWPCGVLICDGGDKDHLKQHPECKPGQDWRD